MNGVGNAAPHLIVVASHRGGSMKSTISALVAAKLATRKLKTIVVDASLGGGVFSLADDTQVERPNAPSGLSVREDKNTPLTCVHAPALLADRGGLDRLLHWAVERDPSYVILDLPEVTIEELRLVTANAAVLLVTLPSEGLSLRSLLPFLRDVQGLRALPGRKFHTILIPTGSGLRTPHGVALDKFIQENLSTLVTAGALPWDDEMNAAVSAGKWPKSSAQASHSNITLIVERLIALTDSEVAIAT